jgi:hypothetical protein
MPQFIVEIGLEPDLIAFLSKSEQGAVILIFNIPIIGYPDKCLLLIKVA